MSRKLHRIAILSDTHGLLRPEVVEVLRTCEVILHGGDINSRKILDELEEIAPVYAVRGNADKEWAEGMAEELTLTLFGLRIYMIHNKKNARIDFQTDNEGTEFFIYGHSHKYEEKTVNGVLFLNPGSCGPRRFNLPATMAVLEVYDDTKPYDEAGKRKAHSAEQHDGIVKQENENAERWRVVKVDLTDPARGIERENAKAVNNEAEKFSQAGHRKLVSLTAGNVKQIVEAILRGMSAGRSVDAIADKLGVEHEFVEQVCRIYVTHPGVDAQGIVDKMEVNALTIR